MKHPKPPNRCPCCGAQLAELLKRWQRLELPPRKVLRYPIAIAAAYHCGARIEARYHVRLGLGGPQGGAQWRLEVTAGCSDVVAHALAHR